MSIFIYILVMAVVTYLIRMIPFVFVKKKIESKFINSILHYLPYAIIAAMTFPAIFYSTGNVITSSVGCVVALILAFLDVPMYIVALSASLSALLVGFII